MKYLFVTVSSVILLLGCSSPGPKCSDPEVQKLVLEITKEQLFKQLLIEVLPPHYEEIVKESKETAVFKEYEEVDNQGVGFVTGTMPIDYFLKFAQVSFSAETVKDIIESRIEELQPNLSAIRTSSENNKVKKCNCDATLGFSNGNTVNIQYSGQLTDDGQVYVEVYDL